MRVEELGVDKLGVDKMRRRQSGSNIGNFSGQLFNLSNYKLFFCLVVAMCNLVHNVDTILHLR